jgi:hypothetical protein
VYRDSFPGLTILGRAHQLRSSSSISRSCPEGTLLPDSYARITLAGLESELARGADSTGRRFTEEERQALARTVAQRRNKQIQIARVKVAPPNLLFERSLTLHLGNRRVEIRDMGRANSPHDVVVWLPGAP